MAVLQLRRCQLLALGLCLALAVLFLTSDSGQLFLEGVASSSSPFSSGRKGPSGKGKDGSPSDPPRLPPEADEKVAVCSSDTFEAPERSFDLEGVEVPAIYFVTPTYPRREQVAELTRLGQTLMHVDRLHWVVADDADKCSAMVTSLLQRFRIPYVHLASPMPAIYKALPPKKRARGVANRRAGLRWILESRRAVAENNHGLNSPESVVYFGDDDNTYDLRLFDEIRRTRKVSVFPVGLVGDQAVSSPIVVPGGADSPRPAGKVIGFTDPWFAHRKFPVDMAGFATNVGFIESRPRQSMPYWVGYEEDMFLQSLNVTMDDLEPLADGCTKVYVWHTKTVNKEVTKVKFKLGDLGKDLKGTNLPHLVSDLQASGLATVHENLGTPVFICTDAKGCETIKSQKTRH